MGTAAVSTIRLSAAKALCFSGLCLRIQSGVPTTFAVCIVACSCCDLHAVWMCSGLTRSSRVLFSSGGCLRYTCTWDAEYHFHNCGNVVVWHAFTPECMLFYHWTPLHCTSPSVFDAQQHAVLFEGSTRFTPDLSVSEQNVTFWQSHPKRSLHIGWYASLW